MSRITMKDTSYEGLLIEVCQEINIIAEVEALKFIHCDDNGYIDDVETVGIRDLLKSKYGVEFSSQYIRESDDMSSRYFAHFDSELIIKGYLNGLTKNDMDTIIGAADQVSGDLIRSNYGVERIDEFNKSMGNDIRKSTSKLRSMLLDLIRDDIY